MPLTDPNDGKTWAQNRADALAGQTMQGLFAQAKTVVDYKDRTISALLRENEALQAHIRTLTKIEDAKGDPFVDQVESVIKDIGKVSPKQFDRLGEAVTKSKSDRAVIRNINR